MRLLAVSLIVSLAASPVFACSVTLNDCSLNKSTTHYSVKGVANPGYLQSYTDPIFNTKITRITGDPGTSIVTAGNQKIGTWGHTVRHQYYNNPAWNADGSLIWLDRNDGGLPNGGVLFLDGNTYQPVYAPTSLPWTPSGYGDGRWNPSDPSVMYYGDGATPSVIGTYNVRTQLNTVIATLTGYYHMSFDGHAGVSLDGNMVVWVGSRISDNHRVAIPYNMSTHKQYPVIDMAAIYSAAPGDTSAKISPLGDYVLVGHDSADGTQVDCMSVYTLNGSLVHDFPCGLITHSDTTVDNGVEYIVGTASSGSTGGQIMKFRLPDGAQTMLVTYKFNELTSTLSTTQPTWALATEYYTPSYTYNGEVILFDIDSAGAPSRVGQDHSSESVYDAQPNAQLSPDGLRVLFTSDWMTSGTIVSDYVIDIRPNCLGH